MSQTTKTATQKVGDLQIDQDLDIQQRIWRIQRIGWGLMGLVVLAALSGLMGNGYFSHALIGRAGGPLRIEYERFERSQTPAVLKVHLGKSATSEKQTKVWISRDYLEVMHVERTQPEPEKTEVRHDRLLYEFERPDPSRETTVTFHLLPGKIGTVTGRVGVEGETAPAFWQFVYP